MATIDSVLLGAADPSAAEHFYAAAFGPDLPVHVTATHEPTTGFRGFTLSLTVAQPADVRALVDAALDAGAVMLKPPTKSFWGYGSGVQAPDGTIWTIATSAKKDTGPATRDHEAVVLLLGVDDVAATKRFYVDRGLTVAKSFGHRYAEFEGGSGRVTLGLYGRRALAKTAGVDPEGSGSHRLAIVGDLGSFADPDGFAWQAASIGATH
ncbi:glyoxalase [Cellulomonas humilata]|uniref:Glyoxalase n=1 Tax=Cellulomonas humilata TaxID=144055 RepID=A0A7Y6A3M4_9CELL|nr:glyoxalase [Cellulomonas humilata]NUU19111.1 glyoxalase [Cellulomonas humilata]